ncbi:molecular chaperone DnaK [bacterium]|nr:molecular chaperone DnaK [bacterium]
MSVEVGIDLGTIHSVIACLEKGCPKVIPSTEGGYLIPSMVAYTGNGNCMVGEEARAQRMKNPHQTIASIKRWMGTNKNIQFDEYLYTPKQISGFILKKVKKEAEAFLGEEVQRAVITVPAYFDDNQRQDTMEAARLAGLEVMRIINEPTAASLAYGLGREDFHRVLVWDLGGGTFDVSLLELGQGVFEVKAVHGDTHLGGDDWDRRIRDYLWEELKRVHNVDLRRDNVSFQKLKEISEKAKKDLSVHSYTTINVPLVQQKEIGITLSREHFEYICEDLNEEIKRHTLQALEDAKLKPREIDRVILVGGSSRMPFVRKMAQNLFGRKPSSHIDPDKVVAMGAAIQAGVLAGKVSNVTLVDVTPLSLGIETMGGINTKIIERNSPIPTSHSQIFTTAQDNQTQVDIHVLQGERALAKDNLSLGEFCLKNIPYAHRGEPQIEVTFLIDSNGILHVSARDLHTGRQKSIEVRSSTRLSSERIQRMLEEARAHKEEDEREKERLQVRIKASSMISAARMVLEPSYRVLGECFSSDLETAIQKLEEALNEKETETLKQRTEELEKKTQFVSDEMKKQKKNEQIFRKSIHGSTG